MISIIVFIFYRVLLKILDIIILCYLLYDYHIPTFINTLLHNRKDLYLYKLDLYEDLRDFWYGVYMDNKIKCQYVTLDMYHILLEPLYNRYLLYYKKCM